MRPWAWNCTPGGEGGRIDLSDGGHDYEWQQKNYFAIRITNPDDDFIFKRTVYVENQVKEAFCPSVRPSVCFIPETAARIFMKLNSCGCTLKAAARIWFCLGSVWYELYMKMKANFICFLTNVHVIYNPQLLSGTFYDMIDI
jgi:hypothetical protein